MSVMTQPSHHRTSARHAVVRTPSTPSVWAVCCERMMPVGAVQRSGPSDRHQLRFVRSGTCTGAEPALKRGI
jgi:hypothetical protein